MGILPDPFCRFCEIKEETARHYLAECDRYARSRFEIFEREGITISLLEIKWSNILGCVNRSKRFMQDT